MCTGISKIKNTKESVGFLNCVKCYESVKSVFGFTKKFFCVACNDFNHITTEGREYKPLGIHL